MTQKAYAEGMRALVLYTASIQDAIAVKEAAGEDATDRARAQRPAAADRQGLRLGEGLRAAAPSRCRPSAAPATCRSTRSSSTSATPRSTPSTRAPPRSRARTSSSGRSSATRAQALTSLAEEIKKFLALGTGGEELAGAREQLAKAAVDLEAIVGVMLTDLAATEQDVKNIYKVGLNTTRLLLASGDVDRRLPAPQGRGVAAEKLETASAKDRPSTPARSRRRSSSRRNVLPGVGAGRARLAEVGRRSTLMELRRGRVLSAAPPAYGRADPPVVTSGPSPSPGSGPSYALR